jgi:hypothetical protein
MSAAFIWLSCEAAIVRGADDRARLALEPRGINIALSQRQRPALLCARHETGFAAQCALRPGRALEPLVSVARPDRSKVGYAVGLTDRKAFKQTQ